ncbi:MAG: hypothetical protein ACXACP_13510 [Candidatus Hodarchaeales archaeon]|jgi:hypothetical protein
MREIKPLRASMIAIAIVLALFLVIITTGSIITTPSPRTPALNIETQIHENEYDFVTIFELINVGEVDFEVYTVYFNDKTSIEYNTEDQPSCFFTNNTIPIGKHETTVFSFPKGEMWISGMEVEVTIQMKSTQEYSKIVTLP